MRSYVFYILIGMTCLNSSCSKFLEETSQSELIPRSAESLNEFLLGSGYPGYSSGLNQGGLYFNDDIAMIKNTPTPGSFNVFTWQHNMIDPKSQKEKELSVFLWDRLYPFIQTCNTVQDYLPKVTGTNEFKSYIAGQSKLLRAYYYFKLANFYGLPYNDTQSDRKTNLAVPLLIVGGVESARKPRNTVEEVYSQIVKDLEDGILLMDQSGQFHNKYRIGSEAGHLLASRVYLYTEKWNDVIRHADELLNNPSYKLEDLRTWGIANPIAKPVVGINSSETFWVFGSTSDVDPFQINERESYRLSPALVASFEEGDLRNGIYFSNRIQTKFPRVAFNQAPGQAFRIAEAYLNKAEALAQLYAQGNLQAGQQCIAVLNELREKRFSASQYVPLDLTDIGNKLLQYVRVERRRELFSEEDHRWFDLKRYGMPSIEHLYYSTETTVERYILDQRDPAYLLPIPGTVKALNSNIVPNPTIPIRQPK
jgi:hypothetical protein